MSLIARIARGARVISSGMVIAGLGLGFATPVAAQEPGLVAHWTFDDGAGTTATDSSGNGNHGVLTNGPQWIGGFIGDGAIALDGIDDLVFVDDPGSGWSLDITDQLTIALWINPTTQTSNHNDKPVSKDNVYEFQIDNGGVGRWNLRLNNASGTIVQHANTRIQGNAWQHVAAVWDGTNVTYYFDGTPDGGYPFTGPLRINDTDIGLGARPGLIYMVHGKLDDMRIYDRALSEAEIDVLFAMGSAGDTEPPVRANGQPSGTHPAGTTEVTLSLDTNERAICKYDTLINTPYALMANTFDVTDDTQHSSLISGLTGGQAYLYYVRCEDIAGNANGDDFLISFSILNDTPAGFHPTDLTPLMFYIESTFFEDPSNRARSIATCNTQECFDAADNTTIDMQYCDTVLDENAVPGARGIAPDGCIRRWEDQSGYISNRNLNFPDELLTGRDFGQDDLEKPIYVPNCINGHPCARGAPASPPEFPQNTSFEIEVADGFGNTLGSDPPTGSPPDTGLADDFSIFHLVRPVQQNENFWYFGCGALRGLRHNVADNSLHYQCGGGGPNPCTGSGDLTGPDAVALDAWQLIEIHRDTANDVRVVINGDDVSLPTPLNAGGDWCYHDVMSRVKGQDAYFGDLAASAVYDRELSEDERQDMRAYLNEIYNFQGTPPRPPEPAVARGYQERACGFDMDDDFVYGEPEDCNVGDGVTTDPDGDGIDEDLIYVDCDGGSDITGDGSPGNPYASINFAMGQADGPSDGAEDIIAFTGICAEDNTVIDVSGVAGFKVRPRSGSEERDFQYPDNPMMIVGWDTDNDGEYAPFDPDETAVLHGGQPGCFTHAFEMGLNETISFIELGHFVVRDYGTCEGADIGSGFMKHKTKSDEVSSHHYFHDISIRDVNKATPNGDSATIIHSLFNGGYLKWAAWENEEILDASGYSYRGSSGDPGGQAGPYRFQGTTRTCFGNGVNDNTGTLCTGWKIWNYTSEVEIIDQVFDMNVDAGWLINNSIANGFALIVQCVQDVVVRNNLVIDIKTFVGMNGFDDGGCNPIAAGFPSRSTKNVRIEGNEWRNTYDWVRGSGSDGQCLNITNCEGFNQTIEDVTFTNNFCSSSVPMNMFVHLNCRQDDGENPGSYRISGNTFVAEGALKNGGIFQSTADGGAFGEDDIEFRDNIVIVPAGEFAMRFNSTAANLNSDYNTFSPGADYRYAATNLGNTLSSWQSATGGDGNSAECVPDFIDRPNGDLHLDPSDACAIDWGTAISNVTLGDIDGDARPQGAGWDIGADEVADGTPPPPDVTPPSRSNGAPSGTLPSGTIQAIISLDTNEVATCRYDTAAGTAYAAMPFTFANTNATQHSTSVGGLSDGASFSYYVRCVDGEGNANQSDFVISFDVDSTPGDTDPPVRSNGAPSGTLPAGTTETVISLDTDEAAACKYDTSGGTDFTSMPFSFANSGGTSHSTTVTGLSDGASFSYFVRCQDPSLNANTDDFVITFDVEVVPPDLDPPVRSNGAPSGTLPAGTAETVISLDTDEAAACKYATVAGTDFDLMPFSFANSGGTNHSTTVTGLTDGGSFSYFVRCQDPSLNANTDDFVIAFDVENGDQTPPAIGGISTSTATGNTVSITVTWTTDEPATSTVNYGTTAAYGASETVPGLHTNHSVTIDCLDRKTTYHLQIESTDAAGNTAVSADQVRRTSGKRPRGSCS